MLYPSTLRLKMLFVILFSIFLYTFTSAHCIHDCNGHGSCNEISKCFCYTGWSGADCSQRLCPLGPSWDQPISQDGTRELQECSNRGTCVDGLCHCLLGYEGSACTRCKSF